MKTPKLPFNLLVVFEALMRHLNVTNTAKHLGVTQAAVSESLAKLRTIFKDELFLCEKTGLVPTALALKLIEPARQLVSDAHNFFGLQIDFNSKTSRHDFKIGMPSYAELLILPALIENIEKSAPNIKIIVESRGRNDAAMLEDGKVDLIISAFPEADHIQFPENLIAQKLLTDEIATCIGRKTNPIFKKKMTLERYLKAKHISMLERERSEARNILDEELMKRNKKRDTIFVTPYYGLIPFYLLDTDYLVTMSNKLADLFVEHFPLTAVPSPIPSKMVIYQLWHPRNKLNPGHIWLRKKIMEIAQQL